MDMGRQKRFWRINVIVISLLLGIWFTVSCICGILFIEPLNHFAIGNLPFGFWMANQGSMLIFVLLILAYALIMDLIERRFFGSEQLSVDHEPGGSDA